MTDTRTQSGASTGRRAAADVLRGLEDIRSELEDIYEDLHAHPELSHQEHRTAGKVADRLRSCGYEMHTGVGGTGVVGVLHNGDGPVVLLRADMDALPVKEDTGLPYASTVTVKDASGTTCRSRTRVATTCMSPACWGPPACCRSVRAPGPARSSLCSSPPRRRGTAQAEWSTTASPT